MPAITDLVGRRFGKLLVQEFAGYQTIPSGKRFVQWKCLCDCGNTRLVLAKNLNSGNTVSCGCYGGGQRAKDLTGLTFGSLTVIGRADDKTYKSHKLPTWLCRCKCGRDVVSTLSNLKTKPSGCKFCACYNTIRAIYEEAYGNIPDGYKVTALDGNVHNVELSNIVALPIKDYRLLQNRGMCVKDAPALKLTAIKAIALERAIAKAEQSL